MAAGDDDELSEEQLIALSVLQISSAFLSVIGSSTIVITLLRDLAQNRSRYMMPYDRIMLSLSTCDILASITFAINQFLLPSESGAIWAFGTPETCRQAGFLTQLFPFWAIWYNCILSYYFLLRILAQRKQQKFNPKYEFWMHITGLYFPITAILGYFRGWYSVAKVGSSCWISDPLLKWIVAGIPTLFTYFSLIANNIVIYVVLRRSLRSSEPEQKRLLNEATTLMFLYVGCFFCDHLSRVCLGNPRGVFWVRQPQRQQDLLPVRTECHAQAPPGLFQRVHLSQACLHSIPGLQSRQTRALCAPSGIVQSKDSEADLLEQRPVHLGDKYFGATHRGRCQGRKPGPQFEAETVQDACGFRRRRVHMGFHCRAKRMNAPTINHYLRNNHKLSNPFVDFYFS